MDLDEVAAIPSGGGFGGPGDAPMQGSGFGSSGAFAVPEQADAAQEPNFDDIPTYDLIQSSDWKARKEAYERCGTNPNEFDLLVENMAKISKESNASAQESLLNTLVKGLQHVPDVASEISAKMGPWCIDKGFTGRPKTAQLAQQLLKTFSSCGGAQDVTDLLCQGFKAKPLKTRQGATQTASSIVEEQGLEGVNMKQLLKAAVPLFNDSDLRVRKEVQRLCVQCYRYTGSSINSLLQDLREVQLQELQQQFSTVEPAAPPQRKSQQQRQQQGSGTGGAAGPRSAAPKTNMIDLDEETPVLSRLPKNFFAVVSNKSEKWQDRLKVINEDFLPLISVPKITPHDDYNDLVRLVKELINDPQMPLTMAGIKAVQAFAGSLKNNFSPYMRIVHSSLFEKMKDKKASMVDLITTTFDVLCSAGACQVESIIDDIGSHLATSKVPHHKQNLTAWLLRLLSDSPTLSPRVVQNVDLTKLLKDDKVEVRNEGVLVMKFLLKHVGERPLTHVIQNLDPKMQAKIADSTASSSNGPRGVGGGVSAMSASALGQSSSSPSKSQGPSTTTAASARQKSDVPPRRVKSATNLAKERSASSSQPKSSTTSPAHSSSASTPAAAGPEKYQDLMSLAEARPRVEQLFDGAVLDALASKEWRGRADAVNNLLEVITAEGGISSADLEANYEAIVALLDNTPGWKDSIVQVTSAVLGLLQELTDRVNPAVPPFCASAVINGLFPRLADAKLKQPLKDLFTSFAKSNVGAKKTCAIVVAATQANGKNAKIIPEAVEWLTTCVTKSSQPVDAKLIIDFTKGFCFEQSLPAIKTAGIKLLVALRCRVGKKLDAFIGDINPHLRASYETELAKYEDEMGSAVGTGGTIVGTGANDSMGVDSLGGGGEGNDLPRVDVAQAFGSAAKDISQGADWKARSNGVKRMEQVLVGAHKHATASAALVSEGFKSLKGRLEEPNKNLVLDSIKTLALVVESFPASQTRNPIKVTLPYVLALLGDQKVQLREAAARFCDLGVGTLGIEVSLAPLIKAVSTAESLYGRTALVDILCRYLEGTVLPPKTLQPLVQPLMKLLGDRSSEIRAMSEKILLVVMLNVGSDMVHRASMDLKPAEQSMLRPVFERTFQLAEEIREQESMGTGSRVDSAVSTPRPPHSAATETPPPAETYHRSNQPSVRPNSPVPQTSTSQKMQQQMQVYTVPELSNAVSKLAPEGVAMACQELLARLERGDPALRDPHLIQALFSCLRRTCYTPGLPTDFVCELLTLIQHLIKDHLNICGTEIMIDICGNVFDCLLSDYVAHAENIVVKSLNMITLQLISHPNFDVVFEALMHHLDSATSEYLRDPGTLRHKYVQLVCRCLLKQKRTDNIDHMLVTLNKHLERFPPSTFKDRDDLSVRTVKTLLNQIINDCDGMHVMERSEVLLGRRCLVYNFLDHSMREKLRRENQPQQPPVPQFQQPGGAAYASQQEPAGRKSHHHQDPNQENIPRQSMGRPSLQNVAPNVQPYAQQQVGAAGGGGGSCSNSNTSDNGAAAPSLGDEVANLFSRARKHAESEQALVEMYQLLKQEPDAKESFMSQLSRCSDAFSKYMKRRLIRLNENDTEDRATFVLPFERDE